MFLYQARPLRQYTCVKMIILLTLGNSFKVVISNLQSEIVNRSQFIPDGSDSTHYPRVDALKVLGQTSKKELDVLFSNSYQENFCFTLTNILFFKIYF